MKKIIKSIAFALLLINLALTVNLAFADDTEFPESGTTEEITTFCTKNPNHPNCFLLEVGGATGLPSFTGQDEHPDATANYLASGAGTATSGIYYIIDIMRFVTSGVAMIVLVFYAIKLISTSADEDAGKAKSGILYSAMGLILIQLASVIVKNMFFGEYGEAFEDEFAAQEFAEQSVEQIRGVIGFVQIFVGAAAVLVIVIRGVTLMTGGGEEEEMTKTKKHILYAMIGLVIAGLSEIILRGVVFPEAGTVMPDVELGKVLIGRIVNFISGFLAIVSFLMLFYAGYSYVAAAGNEEATDKVKKIFLGALLGLVLAMGAYAITNTLIDFSDNPDAEVQEVTVE